MHKCIDILQARETIVQTQVSDFPMIKDEARDKFFKVLKNKAYPLIIREEPRAITTNDLARLLNQGA